METLIGFQSSVFSLQCSVFRSQYRPAEGS